MATRVEVSSIASLRAGPGLGDISREETLKRTYFCQAGNVPGAPSTRILSAKSPLQARLCPLPTAPRPFLKEQVPERKASVKSSWPGATQPCPSAQTAKEEAKADLSEKMPSLAGEEADRGEVLQNGPSVSNKATFLRSGPSTMGLFETIKAGPSLGTGTSEGSRETSSRATQASPLSARPEVATKPALPARKPPVTLPRPTSLSQDPGSTLSQGEAGRAQPLPEVRSMENPAGQASEAKPHPKRRPMSAVFTEYLQPPKPGSGKVPPTPPEKTWVRKPRPLSVDLTSIFESGDTFLRKAASEQSTAERQGPERTSMEPRVDADSTRMDATPQDPDADFQELSKRLHARREKIALKQTETVSPRTPRAMASPGDDQSPLEGEAMSGQQSEKVQESPSPRPGRGQGLAEVKGGRFDQEASARTERKPTGSVRKRLSLFGEDSAMAIAVVSEPAPVTPESPSTAPEPSRAGVNVQARIKGWTVESKGEKPEVRRRTSQGRPLPADLTKLFSRSASSNEIGQEKCATLGGEPAGERREKLKERHGLEGSPATKSLWKSGVPHKSKQTELKDGPIQDPDRCWSTRSAGDAGPSEVSPEDDGSFQKVWATVFEHHVERHTVVDQTGRCLSTTPPCDVANKPDPKPRPENWPGKEPPGVTDKRDRSRWSDHADLGMLGRSTLVDVEPRNVPEIRPVEERHSRSVLIHLESPPVSQRVQPRYDIVHASGERAHSEAVSRVPEEKAMTLRSSRCRLSLSGRQLSQEINPTYLECSKQDNGGAVQRASLIWEARGKEGGGPKVDCQRPRDGFGGTCQSPKWTGGVGASWHSSPVVLKDLSIAQRSPTLNFSLDPPSRANTEPCDSQVQAGPDSLSMQKVPLMVTSEDNPRLAQVSQPEVRMRRSNPSEPRVDRLRRRTLPHDVKFDSFNLLGPESASKRQQKPADGLTSPTCALKRPPLSHQQAQTQEVTPDASQGRTFPVEKPGPSAEPTATFFAVTYQVPNIQKAKSVVKSGPENVSEPSRKTPPPLSPRFVSSVLVSPGHPEPRSPTISQGFAKEREYEEARKLSNPMKSTDQPTSARDRTLDPSRDRVIDVGDLWLHRGSDDGVMKDRKIGASSGRDAPSPVLRQRPKSLLVRRRTEVISETFPGKMRDGYRSTVLDLDALMADYKEQLSKIPSKTQEQQESPTELSGSPRERSGWPKEAEWRRRSLKETPQSDSVGQHTGPSVKALYAPGPSKQPAEPLGTAMATKTSRPLWAPPHSASGENCPSPSPIPAGSRGKSPGISEFESKPSSSEHQGTKHRQSSAKSQEPGSGDPVSPRSPPSDRKKGTLRRSTGQGVEGNGVQWGTPPRDSIWSPLDIKRASSEKGPPARIQEGLSVMQDARQRRREQSKGKPDLPAETPKAAVGFCQRDVRTPEGPKAPLQNLEQRDGRQDGQQPQRQVSPVASVPRRSHSFCKDKRNSPLVNQLKQCFSRRAPEAKDTDTLVQEADSQYGTWADQHQNGGSFGPESPSPDSSAASAGKQPPGSHLSSYTESTSVEQHDSSRDRRSSSVDRSSSELESTDGPEGPPPSDVCPAEGEDDFSFIHQTSVLDSSALKTRVQLSKRSRRRAPISHSLRRSQFSESESRSPLEEESHSTWMFKDSTEEKSPRRDESDEEPPRVERTPVSHPQRMPVFPGMDPAVLKAQLPKRPEVDSSGESLSWTPQPKSPKSPFQPGVLGSRVLPSSTEKEERSEECSPQWLKELKSKKRQSLYENQA